MKIVITGCVFVLDERINDNVRKNNKKTIKVLVNEKNENINVPFDNKNDIKKIIREKIKAIIGSDIFHLEQVYTLGDEKYFGDKQINIIYLAITNIQSIKKDLKKYVLKNFKVQEKNKIILGEQVFLYKTEQKITSGGIEYFHTLKVEDLKLEKNLLELLICYKYLKSRISNTDILFKFLPEKFTLDEVLQVYELVGDIAVDKSNFRKRIIKYIEKIEDKTNKGHRPASYYRFKVNKNDIWI